MLLLSLSECLPFLGLTISLLSCSLGSSESSRVWLMRSLQLAWSDTIWQNDRHMHIYFFFFFFPSEEKIFTPQDQLQFSDKNFWIFFFSHTTFHMLIRLLFVTFVCYHCSPLKEDICFPTSVQDRTGKVIWSHNTGKEFLRISLRYKKHIEEKN